MAIGDCPPAFFLLFLYPQQQGPEIRGDRLRFVVELVPGDAGDRVAGGLQGAVAGAVFAEGGARLVALPAVELDDLALIRPVAVDLEALAADGDPVVEARQRQAVVAEERRKSFLEAAALASRRLFL
jgi:hypothetical protein